MALPVPNLDDRDFARLLADAKALVRARCPEWTDLSAGDPGTTLLEAFAYLTDTLLYRVNRAPEKAYVQFLDLIGVRLAPPASASVTLTFTLRGDATADVVVPRGTRVSAGRGGGDGPTFVTARDATIRAGEREVDVLAHHGETVDGELVGVGTGGPGQSFVVSRPPITLPTLDEVELVVAVEASAEELAGRAPARQVDGRPFRVWSEVTHFGTVAALEDDHVYVVDRSAGRITFAPAVRVPADDGAGLAPAPVLLAAVPPAGREVRVWYRVGGGSAGNVAAGTLTTLKDPLPGVQVTNRAPATGGRDGETLAEALVRGPQAMHTLDRLVTARDYEFAAVASSGGVSRARAVTRAELWRGATPGEVEVLLVPSADAATALRAGPADVAALRTRETLDQVRAALAERSPMGTRVRVGWAGMKTVRVTARVVVHRSEDRRALRDRLDERLRRTLSPIRTPDAVGWPFGADLRVATVYDVLQSERGVRYVSDVRLVVDDVPADVSAVVRDAHQPATWYCGGGGRVLRSVNDAEGWEVVADLAGERVERLAVHPGRPGLVVATTLVGQGPGSAVHVSRDNGDTWVREAAFDFHVEDVALGSADGGAYAFLATDQGLFRRALDADPAAATERILVVAEQPALPCYAVACVVDTGGELRVAVAAQEFGGVYVSVQAGRAGTYLPTGMVGVDVRVLEPLALAGRRFLYAGAYATGDQEGDGVHRLELRGTEVDPQGWTVVGSGWTGGSCLGLALLDETVLAATARRGVTVSAPQTDGGTWRAPAIDCGLPPLEQGGAFEPVQAVAVDPGPLALAGGAQGLFRSADGRAWAPASPSVFHEQVALPPTWLFVSGDHELDVVHDVGQG